MIFSTSGFPVPVMTGLEEGQAWVRLNGCHHKHSLVQPQGTTWKVPRVQGSQITDLTSSILTSFTPRSSFKSQLKWNYKTWVQTDLEKQPVHHHRSQTHLWTVCVCCLAASQIWIILLIKTTTTKNKPNQTKNRLSVACWKTLLERLFFTSNSLHQKAANLL